MYEISAKDLQRRVFKLIIRFQIYRSDSFDQTHMIARFFGISREDVSNVEMMVGWDIHNSSAKWTVLLFVGGQGVSAILQFVGLCQQKKNQTSGIPGENRVLKLTN